MPVRPGPMLRSMREPGDSTHDRRRIFFLAFALVLAASLLMLGLTVLPGARVHQTHAGGADDLSVTWLTGGAGLMIRGAGFRPQSEVSVRVGSQPATAARTDEIGVVQVLAPLDPATVGLAGASVLVTGRARSGATRTLVAASPPRTAGRGPVDLAPWSIGAALVITVVAIRRRGSIWRTGSRRVSILGRR